MKRQISILACLLMLVAIVFAVASCTQPEAAHVHEYVESVTKEATCTEKGEVTFTCSCGDTYVNETSAKGHNVGDLAAVAPTCTTEGKTAGKGCLDCGMVTEAQSTVAALGHELGAPATCTEPQTCARGCGKVFVEALGHKADAPTCTEASVCSVCDTELEAALGHTPTEATCTEASICSVCKEEQAPALGHTLAEGMECFSTWCDRCGLEWVEATKEHEYNCACDLFCKNCYEFTNPNATHSMIYVEAKAPTCTELGNIEYWYCEHCLGVWNNHLAEGWMLNMMMVKISTVDHEYSYACDAHCMNCGNLTNEEAAHSLVHVEAVAPTCTENGNIEYWYCEHCGTCWDNEEMAGVNLNRMNVILSALGHSYFYECDANCMVCGEYTNEDAAHSLDHVAAVAPTCTENGNIEYWQCEFCGTCWDNEEMTGVNLNRMNVIVSATGHTYSLPCDPVCLTCQYINTEAAHNVVHVAAKANNCTEDGNIEYWHCSYCELHWINEDCTINTSAKSVVIPNFGGHKGHDYDRQCDECGLYVLPEVGEAFKLGLYQASKKQTLYITGAMDGYYYATTTNPYKSPDVFLEEANGGYYMYFMKGTTKTYLYVQKSGTYFNPKFGSTKDVWVFDTQLGLFKTVESGTTVYLGTYSTYTTFSASKISYINASNVGKTQFPARPEILEPHDCQMSEATCKAASTCSICGKVEGEKLPHTPGAEATCTAAQTCTVCGTTITAKLAHTGGTATCTAKANCEVCGTAYGDLLPHNYVDGECSVCGAAEPAGLVNATLKFNSTANRTSYSSTQQIWEQNGVKLINDKASSTSNVGNYSNPIRLYQGSKVTIEGKGMTKVVIVRNSNSKATAANIQSYIKSANSGATVTVSGNTITVVFATPVDSFYFSCGAQVRLDSITVNP